MDSPSERATKLEVQISARLDAVSAAEWQTLFRDHPDTFEMVRLQQECGMDGFTFRSIVVREDGVPVLLVPLFQVRFELRTLLEGPARTIVGGLGKVLPGLVAPRLLGVGFVEGEWGGVGVRPGTPPAVLAAAWRLALSAMDEVRRGQGTHITVFFDFPPGMAALLPGEALSHFARIDTYPCGFVDLPFQNIDGYLGTLSKSARKDLRRKLKRVARMGEANPRRALRIQRTTSPESSMEQIYNLYRATVDRAERSLGVHRRSYFEQFCRSVAGGHYVLYSVGDELVAFNLVIDRGDSFVDKYFCMDHEVGRAYYLYFVSWMENVQYCIAKGIHHYHAGTAAEWTKARLGAGFQPTLTLFRHRNPLVHQVLAWMRPLLAYRPAVELPPVELGGAGPERASSDDEEWTPDFQPEKQR